MNILLISSYLPYPLFSGGQVRLYNLIKELSDRHEITLICEKRPNQTEQDVKAVEKICKKVVTVARSKQWSLKNIVKSGMSSHSFLITGHTQLSMQQAIQQALEKEKFDLIHVETFYVMQNVPSTSLPLVLVEHNIEYQVYQKFVNRAALPIRPLLAIDVAKIKREEQSFWKQATKVVAVSDEDKKVIEKVGSSATVVSNGVNIGDFAFKEKKAVQRKILFIGDFKWVQNRDTLTYIIKSIWPLIKKNEKIKNTQLWVVGRKIPESIKNLTEDPDIIFDEKSSSKSTPQIFQEADISLSPIRVGGGTSYKILEAMSCGTPVVTMSMSASAIHAKDEETIMVGDNAEELANKTIQLLENEKLYAKIARNGRQLIEENYSWKKIAKALEAVYQNTKEKNS